MIGDLPFDPVVQRALHAAAATLFLTAAAHKLRDPSDFRASLAAYEVLPAGLVPSAAVLVILLELALAIGCLVPGSAAVASTAGAVLLGLYTLAIGVNLGRGRRSIDCGCGGPGGRRPLSSALLWRNAAAMGLLLIAAQPEGTRALTWLDGLTATALFASAVFLYAAVDVVLANDARLQAPRRFPVDDALIVSNLLLWGVVIVLAAVVLALLRQIGVLHERIAPAGALVGREGPRVGEEAPVLSLSDWNGREITLGGVSAEGTGTLLFFTSPTCPVCKTLLPQLASICAAETGNVALVVASDGLRSEHLDFVAEHDLDRGSYVLSADLGISYQVGRLPYAVLLDEAGIVRARGLVNTREHLESLFEARDLGVASVQDFARREHEKQQVA